MQPQPIAAHLLPMPRLGRGYVMRHSRTQPSLSLPKPHTPPPPPPSPPLAGWVCFLFWWQDFIMIVSLDLLAHELCSTHLPPSRFPRRFWPTRQNGQHIQCRVIRMAKVPLASHSSVHDRTLKDVLRQLTRQAGRVSADCSVKQDQRIACDPGYAIMWMAVMGVQSHLFATS